MRDYLHELFPKRFGFGRLWDTEKKTDAYQMNLIKCPKPEKWQDCLYHTLCFRIDIEKGIRKNAVSCNVRGGNPEKRRKATQVCTYMIICANT